MTRVRADDPMAKYLRRQGRRVSRGKGSAARAAALPPGPLGALRGASLLLALIPVSARVNILCPVPACCGERVVSSLV